VPAAAILHWAARSHSGSRKPRNDDSFIAFASGVQGAEILPPQGLHSLASQDLVFAVSDGMGGGNAGDLASAIILQQMCEIIPETFKVAAAGLFPDCLSHLGEALRSVHEHINVAAAGREECRGMAATLALAWFTPENLYLANAGDSRIYLSRNGQLTLLTRDHTSAFGQWQRGEISEIEFRHHPRRSALYEVVGGGHPGVCPFFAAIRYHPGDRFSDLLGRSHRRPLGTPYRQRSGPVPRSSSPYHGIPPCPGHRQLRHRRHHPHRRHRDGPAGTRHLPRNMTRERRPPARREPASQVKFLNFFQHPQAASGRGAK